MEPYDVEFRGEVLAACDTNEERRLIALRFNVSESWVRRIQQQRRETGQIAPKKPRRVSPSGRLGQTGLSQRSLLGPTFTCVNCKLN